MQYTIRNVSAELDRALKARAKKSGKSVNQVALEALAQSLGQPLRRRSLRNMPGAWSKREAVQFDRFLERHREIDEELWLGQSPSPTRHRSLGRPDHDRRSRR